MIDLRPTKISTDSRDENGALVFVDDALVAVLVKLEDACHGANCGNWYVEAAFGVHAGAEQRFGTLADVLRTLADHAGQNLDIADCARESALLA